MTNRKESTRTSSNQLLIFIKITHTSTANQVASGGSNTCVLGGTAVGWPHILMGGGTTRECPFHPTDYCIYHIPVSRKMPSSYKVSSARERDNN